MMHNFFAAPFHRPPLIAVLLFLMILGAACREAAPQKRYELTGEVVSVERSQEQVTIAHQEIAGLMPAMTMPFVLKSPWAFDVLAPGDSVSAILVIEGDRSWLEEPVITKNSGGRTGATTQLRLPAPGDDVPDFTLLNQDAKKISLHQYRGRALLLTFIYTRCPLPDYCILMSDNFSGLYREIAARPAFIPQTHLLSVSIDPEYDTPRVLREYGLAYLKNSPPDFRRWEFATGSPAEVQAIANFFGLSYLREGDQIVHSLSTAIIGPDGKVYKLYRGNGWKVDEALSDLETLFNSREARPGGSSAN